VLDAAFDVCDALELANLPRGKARAIQLAQADQALARLRTYLRPVRQAQAWLPGVCALRRRCARFCRRQGNIVGLA